MKSRKELCDIFYAKLKKNQFQSIQRECGVPTENLQGFNKTIIPMLEQIVPLN